MSKTLVFVNGVLEKSLNFKITVTVSIHPGVKNFFYLEIIHLEVIKSCLKFFSKPCDHFHMHQLMIKYTELSLYMNGIVISMKEEA